MAQSLNIIRYKVFDPMSGEYWDFESFESADALAKRTDLILANADNPNLTEDLHVITGVALDEEGRQVWVALDTATLQPIVNS